MKFFLIAPPFVMLLSSPLLAGAEEITKEMRLKAEEVIQNCEKSYQNVKDQKKRFKKIKKPSRSASKQKKAIYKDKALNIKTFEIQFAEFSHFTNEKISIRTAKTPAKLRDQIAAYSSNCARFSAGLSNFVEWAVTGTAEREGYETIYKDWQDDARGK